MIDAPVVEELACGCGGKLGASARSALVGYAECSEGATKAIDQTFGAFVGAINDRPVRVPVDYDEIVDTTVVKEIGTQVLEWVFRLSRWCWWSAGL